MFHKAILMSGSDLCEWATVDTVYNVNALEYAKELGKKVGCDPFYGMPIDRMVDCLRYKHFEEIVNATATVWKVVSGNSTVYWWYFSYKCKFLATKVGIQSEDKKVQLTSLFHKLPKKWWVGI